jgi:hypothetical protein
MKLFERHWRHRGWGTIGYAALWSVFCSKRHT